jgi:integrase/recombinase XerD
MVQNRITLSQAIEGYFIAAHARRLSHHTLSDYDNTFRKFEAFLGNDPPLAEISAADVREFLGSLDGLSAKTMCNYHVGLSALWTWATKEGLADCHVVRLVTPPRPEKRDVIPYTERDIKAMLNACDSSEPYTRPGKRKCTHRRATALRDRAIITLLLDTGVRASELCDLRLSDVDLKNHRIRVMGKGRKERLLPVCPRTAQVVWRYLATRPNARSAEFLFTTGEGSQIQRNSTRQILKRIGDRAGVPGVTVHRFRHTFAITFLRNGGQMLALQRMLGHSTLEMVTRYLAIADADIERAHQDASPVANWLV